MMAALRAFPDLEIAAGEVVYQTIAARATVARTRKAALELKATLDQWLSPG